METHAADNAPLEETPRGKQTGKTLFIVFGVFLALALLVALNMK